MDLSFGKSAFVRDRGNYPEISVVNMVAEQEQTEEGLNLLSRPGLIKTKENGTGPIRAVSKQAGVLSDSLFSVSGANLYLDTTSVGTIDYDGTPQVSLAGYSDRVFVTGGKNLFQYNGAFSAVTVPDGNYVLKVLTGASRLIVLIKGTQTFYWSDVLSSTIGALSFATAENLPDGLLDAVFVGDTLILFGQASVEHWPVTQDATLPFQPLIGRTFDVGIKNTGAAVKWNSNYIWVTNQNRVCITSPDNVISFDGLEARIQDSATAKLWKFELDGDEYIGMTLDSGTWVYRPSVKTWSTFESYGLSTFIPSSYSGGYFGSSIDGKLYSWDTTYTDPTTILERKFTAYNPINTDGVVVDNLSIRVNSGQTPDTTGEYLEPVIEMRFSRDGGQTFSDWRPRSLGKKGEYRKKVYWTGLGMFSYPGALFEFRVTDPVTFRISSVTVNEPIGGR